MQISKQILLHLLIICILIVVNLCTASEMITKEEILDSNIRKIKEVENVVQSAAYGLGLSKNFSTLCKAYCTAVEHKLPQFKGSELSIFRIKGCEEFSDPPDRIQIPSIIVEFTRDYTVFRMGDFCCQEDSGMGILEKRKEAYLQTACSFGMILSEKIEEEERAWKFVKPFTPGMWWTTAAIMVYTSLVVCLVEQNMYPLIYSEMSTTEVFLSIWSAVSTTSLSQYVRIESRSARIVIAVWLLVMFIIVSSYADNFNSRINEQKRSPTETPKRLGVKDFLGLFIITLMVSTMTLLIFLFNLLHGSGATGQETDRQLEMLPTNDDSVQETDRQLEMLPPNDDSGQETDRQLEMLPTKDDSGQETDRQLEMLPPNDDSGQETDRPLEMLPPNDNSGQETDRQLEMLPTNDDSGQETDRQLEMLPPNDDSEEQSSVQGERVQTMLGTSTVREAEENTLVEASSISILHTANESPSIEDQNV